MLEEEKKIALAFSKAIASPSTREKNQILNEMKNSLFALDETLVNHTKSVSIKRKELDSLTKKYEETMGEFKSFKSHAGFLDVIAPDVDGDRLPLSIGTIEDEIVKYGPVKRADLLRRYASIADPKSRYIHLRDLYSRRLEEKAYLLKKRLLSIEENNEMKQQIASEFGSVNNLIDMLGELEDENDELKRKEAMLIDDMITKRRPFKKLSSQFLSELAYTYQAELKTQCKLLGESNQGKDIDECLSDEFFNLVTKLGFFKEVLTPEDSLRDTNEVLSVEEAYNMTETAIEFHKDSMHKIQQEITRLRTEEKAVDETSLSKVDRLVSLNQRLMGELASNQEKLVSIQDSVSSLFSELHNAIIEKSRVETEYAEVCPCLKNLVDDHISLMTMKSVNRDVSRLLVSVSSQFGRETKRNSMLFKDYIRKILRVEPQKHDNPPIYRSRSKIIQTNKIVRPVHKVKSSSKIPLVLNTIPEEPYSKVFTNVMLLSSLCEIGGQVLGHENKYHEELSASWRHIVDVFHNDIARIVSEAKDTLYHDVSSIGLASNAVLIKEKVDTEIQSTLDQYEDAETNTDPIKKHK